MVFCNEFESTTESLVEVESDTDSLVEAEVDADAEPLTDSLVEFESECANEKEKKPEGNRGN